MIFIALFWISSLFAAYSDPELDRLWASIPDINKPTLSDYLLINDYLKNSERPYLDPLRLSMCSESLGDKRAVYHLRMDRILNFNLLGPNNEMPLFEIHKLNERRGTEKRCIVIYGSNNGPYPARARRLLADLERCGYSGHVLLRIGGFPNTPNGGLKICYVPYAFKVASLREAQNLGYTQVLWLDASLHPLNDLEKIFAEIAETGYFFMSSCSIKGSFVGHMDVAMKALSITEILCEQIPHVYSPILGLNLDKSRAAQLLNEWYVETQNVYPYMSPFHEDLSLSTIAHRLGMRPQFVSGDIFCLDYEVLNPYELGGRTSLHFYIDSSR